MANYPEWDFGYDTEMSGIAGKLGECTLLERLVRALLMMCVTLKLC